MLAKAPRSTTAAAFVLFLALVLLAWPLPATWSAPWRAKVLDLGHLPLFAACTWFLAQAFGGRPWLAAAIGIVGAGLGELLQEFAPGVRRQGDWADFVRGALGCLWAVFLLRLHGLATPAAWRHSARIVWGVLGSVALLSWPAYDAWPVLADAWHAWRQYPVLADFTGCYELGRWRANQATLRLQRKGETSTKTVLEIVPKTDATEYPGANFRPPMSNWTGYQTLSVVFELEGHAADVWITVRDFRRRKGFDERFNLVDHWTPGLHDWRIPLQALVQGPTTTPLRLDQVEVVQLFFDKPGPGRLRIH